MIAINERGISRNLESDTLCYYYLIGRILQQKQGPVT